MSRSEQAEVALRIRSLGKRYDISPTRGPVKNFLVQANALFRPRTKPQSEAIWALKHVDLDVPKGAIIGVIGRNGAGKTTLLRIVGRITSPTEGTVEGVGRIFPMLEVGISFHPDFTARENVFLNAAMFGIPRSEVQARLGEIMAFSGIGDRIDDKVRALSRGLYVRLAFATAILMRPNILLADEVLAVGDAEFRAACLARIREERKRGMSIMFVSHDMGAITEICDFVVWLDSGRVRQVGPAEAIVAAYEHDLWGTKLRQIGAAEDDAHPVRLIAARCLGKGGGEVSEIVQDDPVCVELIFDSTVAGVRVSPGVDLFSGGALLFSCWRSEPFLLPKCGTFAARLQVPAWSFTAQEIRCKASLRVQKEGAASYICDGIPEAILRIHGAHLFDSDRKLVKRQSTGFIVPKIDWTVDYELNTTTAGD